MQDGQSIPSSCITVPESFNAVVSEPVNNNIVFKRKFRWTFEADFPFGKIPATFVKVAARPTLELEEINYLNAKFPVPNTQRWSEIGITYMSINETDSKELYEVIGKMYQQIGRASCRERV